MTKNDIAKNLLLNKSCDNCNLVDPCRAIGWEKKKAVSCHRWEPLGYIPPEQLHKVTIMNCKCIIVPVNTF